MSNYGIKIAKSDYNINSPDHKMIMTSKFPLLKLFDSDEGTMTKIAHDGGVTATINHDLGYIPQTIVYGQSIDPTSTYGNPPVINEKYRLFSFHEGIGLGLWEYYLYWADEYNLYIFFSTDGWKEYSVSLDYMYHIFYDPEE